MPLNLEALTDKKTWIKHGIAKEMISEKELPASTEVFSQGDKTRDIVFLKTGWTHLFRRSRGGAIRTLGIVHAPALLAHEAMEYSRNSILDTSAMTLTTSEIMTVEWKHIQARPARLHPDLAIILAIATTEQIRQRQKALGLRSGDRFLQALITISEIQGTYPGFLPNQELIGELAGLVRETANKFIKKTNRKGAIQISSEGVVRLPKDPNILQQEIESQRGLGYRRLSRW